MSSESSPSLESISSENVALRGKIKKLRKTSSVWLIFSILMFILLIITFSILPPLEKNQTTPEIVYPGMNVSEIQEINRTLSHINPIYFNHTKQIIFTKNIHREYGYITKLILSHTDYYNDICGTNVVFLNKIYVVAMNYTDSCSDFDEILCHELLHDFLYPTDDAHKIVYSLGERLVCYEDSFETSKEVLFNSNN